MEGKELWSERIYKVLWDGCTWLVSGKEACKREAERLKVLHPDDNIIVTEKTVVVKEIEF